MKFTIQMSRVITLIIACSMILSQIFVDEFALRFPDDIGSGLFLIGDIDSDCDLDIITIEVYESIRTATVLTNNGFGYFEPTSEFEMVLLETKEILVDMDSDGDLDIFGTFEGNSEVYLNTNGEFILVDSLVSEIYPPLVFGNMATGDLQGDGDVDICSASAGPIWDDYNPGMFINYNNSFLSCQFYPFWISMFLTPSINDFNQDGRLDIAGGYFTHDSSRPTVSGTLLLLYNGYNYDYVQYQYPQGTMLNFTYDFDFDGDVDIIGNTLMVNTGGASFSVASEGCYPSDANSPLCIGDLDGDNLTEAITYDTLSGNYFFEVLEYEDSVYTYSDFNWVSDTFNYFNQHQLYDIDNDGDLDLLFNEPYIGNKRLYINTLNNGGAVNITESSVESISPALSDGVDSIQVLITIRDALENPLIGRAVKLNVNGTGLIITQPLRLDGTGVTTDANGQVVIPVYSDSIPVTFGQHSGACRTAFRK